MTWSPNPCQMPKILRFINHFYVAAIKNVHKTFSNQSISILFGGITNTWYNLFSVLRFCHCTYFLFCCFILWQKICAGQHTSSSAWFLKSGFMLAVSRDALPSIYIAAGNLSPRRGLTVSPWCGRDTLPSICMCWYLSSPAGVQLLRAATRSFWLTLIILDQGRFSNPFWKFLLEIFCEQQYELPFYYTICVNKLLVDCSKTEEEILTGMVKALKAILYRSGI